MSQRKLFFFDFRAFLLVDKNGAFEPGNGAESFIGLVLVLKRVSELTAVSEEGESGILVRFFC